MQDHYVFVTDFGLSGEVAVLDIRNPSQIREIARRDVPGSFAWDVKVDGDRMYVASQLDSRGQPAPPLGQGNKDEIGVSFYDISDPSDPTQTGFVPIHTVGSHNVYPDGDELYVIRNRAFIDGEYQYIVEVWDVADAANPERLAMYDPTDESRGLVNDVYVQDDLAYIAAFDAGLRVLDVSDPANPVEAGHRPGPTGGAHYTQPLPNKDILFVGDEIFSKPWGGIHVLDTSDLSNIEKIGFIEPPEGETLRTSHNFDVTANRLHTSWYNGGIKVFDITDPESPSEIASYNADGSSFWTAVHHRSFTIGSDLSRGSISLLHTDRGSHGPPAGDASSVDVQGDGRPHTVNQHPGPDQ